MGDILNPDDVSAQISAVRNQIAEGVRTISDAEEEAKDKRRAFDLAYAKAYLNADGAAYMRRYKATVETMKEREAMDIADLAFSKAEREGWALIRALGAWQTISNSVVALYGSVRA